MKAIPFLMLATMVACTVASEQPRTAQQFGEDYVRVYCESRLACQYEDNAERLFYRTQERCEEVVAPLIQQHWTWFDEGVQEGRLRLDEHQAAHCLARLSGYCSHDTYWTRPASALTWFCREVFEGVLAEGAACNQDVECLGDSYCRESPDPLSACSGTCEPRGTVGEACEYQDCAGLLVCGDRCIQPTFRDVTGEEGEPCSFSLSQPLCASGLVCSDVEGRWRCVVPPVQGEACDVWHDRLCEDGTVCRSDVCVPILLGQVGDQCGDIEGEYVICDPVENLSCRDEICTAARSPNDTCGSFYPVCSDGELCRGPLGGGWCMAPAELGDLGDPGDPWAWTCRSGVAREDVCTPRYCGPPLR